MLSDEGGIFATLPDATPATQTWRRPSLLAELAAVRRCLAIPGRVQKSAGNGRGGKIRDGIRAGQGTAVIALQNRRLSLRWFESITRHQQQERPLTSRNAGRESFFVCPAVTGPDRASTVDRDQYATERLVAGLVVRGYRGDGGARAGLAIVGPCLRVRSPSVKGVVAAGIAYGDPVTRGALLTLTTATASGARPAVRIGPDDVDADGWQLLVLALVS